jgi:hypothetical protein
MFAGCPGDIVSEKSVIISGVVQSATTHTPVTSAWVALADSLLGPRAETDSAGTFSIGSFPITRESLFVGADGFKTFDTLLEDVHGDTDTILIELVPSPQAI